MNLFGKKKPAVITKEQLDALLIMSTQRDQAAGRLSGRVPGQKEYPGLLAAYQALEANVQQAASRLFGGQYTSPEELAIRISGELLRLAVGVP